MHRPRYGRSGHRQNIDRETHLLQFLLVPHPETLLLIDDQEAEITKADIAGEKPVRADNDVHFTGCKIFENPLLFGRSDKPAQQSRPEGEIGKALREGPVMLLSQERGGYK